MRITKLTNSFHGTEITVRVPDEFFYQTDRSINRPDLFPEEYSIDQRQYVDFLAYHGQNGDSAARQKYNRIMRTLCGMSDCCCGGVR